jgi:hypothetical protein
MLVEVTKEVIKHPGRAFKSQGIMPSAAEAFREQQVIEFDCNEAAMPRLRSA